MINGDSITASYIRRALLYCCVAAAGSSIGSMWTWTTDDWSDADPLTDGCARRLRDRCR